MLFCVVVVVVVVVAAAVDTLSLTFAVKERINYMLYLCRR